MKPNIQAQGSLMYRMCINLRSITLNEKPYEGVYTIMTIYNDFYMKFQNRQNSSTVIEIILSLLRGQFGEKEN